TPPMAKSPKNPHCSSKRLKIPSTSSYPMEISDSSSDYFLEPSSSKTKKPLSKKP
ncbi:hypothetical protein HAX54_004877, partial [Datura stramonium]|nr:hypothetical protein [Datura stramonium]